MTPERIWSGDTWFGRASVHYVGADRLPSQEEHPTTVAREYAPRATFECPSCGGVVDTEAGILYTASPEGAQFIGVPCPGCGKSYTVEIS